MANPAAVATTPAINENQRQSELLHGNQFIGQNIMGGDNQEVGTVKDFIIDYQPGGCPMIYFAYALRDAAIGRRICDSAVQRDGVPAR